MSSSKSQLQLTEELKQKAAEEGFNPIGVANVPGSPRIKLRTQALERWLNAGFHADMKWMEAPRRKRIETLLDGVQSLMAVGLNYYVDKEKDPEALSIARYGWGNDYHKVMEKRLKRIGKWLEEKRPECKWKVFVDTGPLLDKAWAEEAGIGWIGKNSNLINPQSGSWLVLGHLLCTEKLTPDKPSKPLCGKCKDCISACPTNAITEPFVINAEKCIAYHTIENREAEIPEEIRKSLKTWVAGCDICQEICPWNKKGIKSSTDPDVQPKDWILKLTKNEAMSWSDEKWRTTLKGSAFKRIKPWMWRRNAKAI